MHPHSALREDSEARHHWLSVDAKGRTGNSLFHTFSSMPSRSHSPDILKEIQSIFVVQGLTFGTLIKSTLWDTTSSLGTAMITELANILEVLRPPFSEGENARVLLGQFFASVAAPELSQFEKGDDEMSRNLSAEQLMRFSLDAMGGKVASDAPGLSSFLDGICSRRKLEDCDMDIDDDAEGDGESESESGAEGRRKVSPAQLLKIVSLLICCAMAVYLHSSLCNRGKSPLQASS